MYYLYRKTWNDAEQAIADNDFLKRCSIERFTPTLLHLGRSGEKMSIKTRLGRLYFWLLSKGEFVIYYLCLDDCIAHSSYVVPRCFKFPFMNVQDYEIGPCMTANEFRRRGCYRFVLKYITTDKMNKTADFYMIVRDTNLASIAGIERAGFRRCGFVVRNSLLNYKKVEN